MTDSPFTSAEFHNLAQKHIVNAVYETLLDGKMDWALIQPFLDAARQMCRSDFLEAGRLRFHAVRAEGEGWVEAEEAYLGLAIPDRDDGQDWLAETYWVSELALADRNPEEVRRIVAALERSIVKVNAWLEAQQNAAPEPAPEQEEGGPEISGPPSDPASP